MIAMSRSLVTLEENNYYGDRCTTATPVKSSYTPVSKKPIMLRMINAKASFLIFVLQFRD